MECATDIADDIENRFDDCDYDDDDVDYSSEDDENAATEVPLTTIIEVLPA